MTIAILPKPYFRNTYTAPYPALLPSVCSLVKMAALTALDFLPKASGYSLSLPKSQYLPYDYVSEVVLSIANTSYLPKAGCPTKEWPGIYSANTKVAGSKRNELLEIESSPFFYLLERLQQQLYNAGINFQPERPKADKIAKKLLKESIQEYVHLGCTPDNIVQYPFQPELKFIIDTGNGKGTIEKFSGMEFQFNITKTESSQGAKTVIGNKPFTFPYLPNSSYAIHMASAYDGSYTVKGSTVSESEMKLALAKGVDPFASLPPDRCVPISIRELPYVVAAHEFRHILEAPLFGDEKLVELMPMITQFLFVDGILESMKEQAAREQPVCSFGENQITLRQLISKIKELQKTYQTLSGVLTSPEFIAFYTKLDPDFLSRLDKKALTIIAYFPLEIQRLALVTNVTAFTPTYLELGQAMKNLNRVPDWYRGEKISFEDILN